MAGQRRKTAKTAARHAGSSRRQKLLRRAGLALGLSTTGIGSMWALRATTALQMEMVARAAAVIMIGTSAVLLAVVFAALFSPDGRVYGRLVFLIQTVASIFTSRVRPNLRLLDESVPFKAQPRISPDRSQESGLLEDLQRTIAAYEAAKERHAIALRALQVVLTQLEATKEDTDVYAGLNSAKENPPEVADGDQVDQEATMIRSLASSKGDGYRTGS